MKHIICVAAIFAIAGCGAPASREGRFEAEAPELYSTTHPKEGWSRERVAVIRWKRPAGGVGGYAIMINKSPRFVVQPLVNLGPESDKFATPPLEDGIHYFHLRAMDAEGVPGKTAHYPLRVCADEPSAPLVESPTHPSGKTARGRSPKLIWNEGGPCVKGYYYSLSPGAGTEPVNFIDRNGVEFRNLAAGEYTFSVRALGMTGIRGPVSQYVIIIR